MKMKRKNKTKQYSPKSPFDKALLVLQTPENIPYQRGIVWKIVMSLITLGAITLGIVNDAWSFSLAIFAFAITYYLVHLTPPQMLTVKISEAGVKIGNITYPYSKINAFWITYQSSLNTLHLRINGQVLSDLKIQLLVDDPMEIQKILKKHLKQLPIEQESFVDSVLRLLKI